MKRSLQNLLTLLLALWATAAVSAPADKRVALVIGNAAYDHFGRLSNPGNDAEDIATVLRRVGFEVLDGRDLSRRDMDRKLAQFSRLSLDAETALVYYAGHGLQYQSQNYLVPTDALLRDGFDVPFETIAVESVIGALDNAKGARILILDACRDLPLKDAGKRESYGGPGLASVVGRKGLIMAYATQANHVAFDGSGRNSFYAEALLKAMQEPGLEIGQVFQHVAKAVAGVTEGRQLPEVTRSYPGEVFINRDETDMQAWGRLRGTTQLAELRRFVEKYPRSFLVEDALGRIRMIEGQARAGFVAQADGERDGPRAQPDRLALARPAEGQQAAQQEIQKARRQEEDRLAELARKAREEQARQEQTRQEQVRQEQAGRDAEQARIAAARAQIIADEAKRREEQAKREAVAVLAAPAAAAGQADLARIVEAAKPAEVPQTAYAALSIREENPAAKETSPATADDAVVRSVQQRLADLGCYTEPPETAWGRQSMDALERFYRFSQSTDPTRADTSKTRAVRIVSTMPDQGVLETLNSYSGRICPISCPTGTEPRGEICVRITCPPGMSLDGDECRPQRRPIQATLPAETTKKPVAEEAKETKRPKAAALPEPEHKPARATVKEAPRPVKQAARPVEVERPVKPKVKVVEPIRARTPVPALARAPRAAPAPARAAAAPSYTPAEIGASRMMSRMP
ncbi:caspase family protein [Methylobacterium oryzisoli]|uniref:caspase family protein n=1 Tax=Methylobacterium oryzisoli TaxID=3385502 RepID=UPI0038926C91